MICQEGKGVNIDILKLCSEGFLPSCYGNNQGAPYCIFTMPPAPGQNPAQGQDPPIGYNPQDPGNYPANPDFVPPGAMFKLRADEAVVYIGKTPPGCTYFSYIFYICLTENKPGKDYSNVFVTGNDTVGHYHRIFGSLQDPINNFNIRTENNQNGSGNVFDSSTILVVSADKNTSGKVKAALVRAGFDPSIINESVIPSGVVRMGLEKGKDTFTYLARMAQWKDEQAGHNYVSNLDQFGRVFRITPKVAGSLDPLEPAALKPRGTGETEFQIVPNLSQDMDTLRSGIISKYGTGDYTYQEFTTDLWVPDGLMAYANDTDALADNRDAAYLVSPDFQLNSDDDFVVVYGLNHDKSGKTVYGNIVLYGRELLNGVVNVFSGGFPGSANAFFPVNYEGADNYYVCIMARKQLLAGEECLIIPTSTGNPLGKAYGVDNDKNVFACVRAYYEQKTGIGPSYSELFHDRVIVFHRK
jgi:hypothetical protein